MGIINHYFRFQQPNGHTTYSLSIEQHPLFQGNQILIINEPLNSGRNKQFRGNNNNLMEINAYPSNNCINLQFNGNTNNNQ